MKRFLGDIASHGESCKSIRIVCFFVCVFICGCVKENAGLGLKRSPGLLAYSIAYVPPQGWQEKTLEGNRGVEFLSPQDGNARIIVRYPQKAHKDSFSIYLQMLRQGNKPVAEEKYTLCKVPSTVFIFQHQDKTGTTIMMKSLQLYTRGSVYIVSYEANLGNFERLRSEFEKSLATFKIL